MMAVSLGRCALAVCASLAIHFTVVAAWSARDLNAEDESSAGAMAQVEVALSPAQFYPSAIAEAASVEKVSEVSSAQAKAVLEPAPATILKPAVKQEIAAIAPTIPTETKVDTTTAKPSNPAERAKRSEKRPSEKNRKIQKKNGKSSESARRTSNSSSVRKGTARRKVGDGGRSSTAVGRATLSSYLGRIASKVRRQKRYPKAALRRKTGGTAVVAFTITKRGTVKGVRLKRRSGNEALDREVLNMVRRAAPFPPIPKGTGRSRIALSIPVRFALR